MRAYTIHPNTLSVSTCGFYRSEPHRESSLLLRLSDSCSGDRQLSPQPQPRSFASANIERAVSTMVWFILSATPFCSGFFGSVNSCLMPSFLRYPSNYVEVNSPPLSVLKTFSSWPVDFSAIAFNSRKCSDT